MKKVVSFLIGSGFSVPAEILSVREINKRLSKVDESEIMIHSDMTAWFLNHQIDNNRYSRWEERYFVQEFLEFYCTQILANKNAFHYETFYDFYSAYLDDGKTNSNVIDEFCQEFTHRHTKGESTFDTYNRIAYFNRTYNQLLGSLLFKSQFLGESGIIANGKYSIFIQFIRELIKSSDVKVHSLNHDLFFDWIGRHQSGFWEHFSDGFEYDGSPFYGVLRKRVDVGGCSIEKNYRVKLPLFTGSFNSSVCLFKLHGSINNTVIHTSLNETYRIHNEYGIDEIFLERRNEMSGKVSIEGVIDRVDPDFLSGTTSKPKMYQKDAFYKGLLEHFVKNLRASDALIVIGYGFADPGINEYLELNFLSRGKEIIIIDPTLPECELLGRYRVRHIKSSITDVSFEQYNDLI